MYKNEKRFSIFFLFVLFYYFFFGILFGYYVIVPFSINFLSSYAISNMIENKIHFISFIKTITTITLTTGFLFQLPLVIYFLTKFNILNSNQLKQYRRHAFVVILVLASIVTPPDMFSQVLIGLPIFILYEFSILISILTSPKMKLIANNLKKKYGERYVVNDVSISLKKGEIVGLLGPNGAGKTTTFYMLVGLIKSFQGDVLIDNMNISNEPMHIRARKGLGYLPQQPSVFTKMSVKIIF